VLTSTELQIIDLGSMAYRDAWAVQESAHAQVLAGAPEQLLLVEHPPVITFGRRPGIERNLIASESELTRLGVEVVHSDRGGDITFHGPGQIVAYPIIRLIDHGLSVSGYVHMLESVVIASLADFGISANADPAAVGVWTMDRAGALAKVCAIGVRIRHGVTLHGLALNVETDLRYFNLIVPCGLPGRAVTSLRELLGDVTPSIDVVKAALIRRMNDELNAETLRRRGR
jgi:lipoate-protein ligase B